MGEHARILVVDDDESIRKAISTVLEEKGYSVDTAENGKEAIRKTNSKFFNLALIDIRLPDMEGTKLLTRIKETTPKMVKIILTGYPALQNAIEALNKGADAYLLKPVNMDTLLDTIDKHLNKQQEAKKLNEEKIAEFIEARVRELDNEETVAQENPR
jgi:DNA-binding NtrC family response regulator